MWKRILAIVALVIILAIVLLTVGITINISGVFIINTKYFTTPLEAYENESSTIERSVSELMYVRVDDYNGISLLIADDVLIIAQMKTNFDKYYYLGNKIEYETNGNSIVLGTNNLSNSFSLLGSKLKSNFFYSGKIYCEVVFTEDYISENNQIKLVNLPNPLSDYSMAFYTDD